MARMRMKGFDKLEKFLQDKAGKAEDLAKRCVYTGAYAAADEIRKRGEAAIMKDAEHRKRQTGELFADGNFGVTPIQSSLGGTETSVGFQGYDSKGDPIPAIAAALESGNSLTGRQGTHFFSQGVRAARSEAYSSMQKLVKKFMENEGDE